jgi:hypothetical protein
VYATNRTANGFDVAENPGGTSTVDIDYRIVATPFADRAARLPSLPPVRKAILATEVDTARSISRLNTTEAAVRARGKIIQSTATERRATMAQTEMMFSRQP